MGDIIAEALRYQGQREGAPNRSGGFIVDACQKLYGLQGVPWCGCYVGYVNNRASGPYREIAHPAVAVTYDRAKAGVGGVKLQKGGPCPPGSLFLIRGKHIGFVLSAPKGSSTFRTIEGNAGDACRSLTRAWRDGWEVITHPSLGTAAVPSRGYGFDDSGLAPSLDGPWRRLGGWKTAKARDAQMEKRKAKFPDRLYRPAKSDQPAPFYFDEWEPGGPGPYDTWRFGPWADRAGRDELMKVRERNTGRQMRPWSRPIAMEHGAITGTEGKTT